MEKRVNSQVQGARSLLCNGQVDTEENAHLRGDNDYVHVLAKHKGRTTGHADTETTEGLCADPFSGRVDSHNTA